MATYMRYWKTLYSRNFDLLLTLLERANLSPDIQFGSLRLFPNGANPTLLLVLRVDKRPGEYEIRLGTDFHINYYPGVPDCVHACFLRWKETILARDHETTRKQNTHAALGLFKEELIQQTTQTPQKCA